MRIARLTLAGFVTACTWSSASACSSFSEPPASSDAAVETSTPTSDASAEAPSDGGPTFVSDPGRIACDPTSSDPNEQTCESGKGEVCCYTTTDARTCKLEANCTAPGSVRCDEAADCTNGALCCAGATGLRTGCQTSCNGAQVCKTNEECKGGTCEPYECFGRRLGACSNAEAPPVATCTKL